MLGRKLSCKDERLSPGKRFFSGEMLLGTRLEIPPFTVLSTSSVQGAATSGHETNVNVAFSPAVLTVFISRMKLSLYIFSVLLLAQWFSFSQHGFGRRVH